MATAPTTFATAEGSLYELVARGNKDVFFYQDLAKSLYAFDNAYEAQTPFTREMRRVPPKSSAEFGRTVEFEFDLVGDVMTNPTLLIQLPSWIPPQQLAVTAKTLIKDSSGVSFGYVNGIGYFLFELIQFYQDNILLQEFSGDGLWAQTRIQGSYAHTFVDADLAGEHNGSNLAISRNGAPPLLRMELPLIGNQSSQDSGFPQRSVTQHTYKLRCKLRRLEDLIEASDGRSKPTPWTTPTFQQYTSATASTSFVPLPREAIPPLTLQLETTQVYLPRDYQDVLQTQPQRISFRRTFENRFTQNQLDYQGVTNAGTSFVNRRLDGRHPTGRLLWFARAQQHIRANQLWRLQPFYTSVSLTIAGQTRESDRSSRVWRDLTNFAKEELDADDEISTMNWTLGPCAPSRFPAPLDQITGAVNLTTADRPTFYINLATAPIDPQTNAPNTELLILTEGWAFFDTDGKGRAELYSMN